MFYEQVKEGVILKIKLNPKAKQNNVAGIFDDDEVLKINVTSPPENNKANKALINLLSSKMKLAKSCFEIISGKISKNKKILIIGNFDFLENKLKALVK